MSDTTPTPPSARWPAPLRDALAEAEPMIRERGWSRPTDATLHEAEALLSGAAVWPTPEVSVNSDGAVLLDWEADAGWLQLRVDGSGAVTHSGVIDGDDYAQTEPLGPVAEPSGHGLPAWAAHLLGRLLDPPPDKRVHH